MYEKITKYPNFTWYFPAKAQIIFHDICPKKIFSRIFFLGGGRAPASPRLSYAYAQTERYEDRYRDTVGYWWSCFVTWTYYLDTQDMWADPHQAGRFPAGSPHKTLRSRWRMFQLDKPLHHTTTPQYLQLLQLPVMDYGTVYRHISQMQSSAVNKDIFVWIVGHGAIWTTLSAPPRNILNALESGDGAIRGFSATGKVFVIQIMYIHNLIKIPRRLSCARKSKLSQWLYQYFGTRRWRRYVRQEFI